MENVQQRGNYESNFGLSDEEFYIKVDDRKYFEGRSGFDTYEQHVQ